jgi:hypothetical protein
MSVNRSTHMFVYTIFISQWPILSPSKSLGIHQDVRKLQGNRTPQVCTFRCNRISHIKISICYNATGCPKSRYPYITIQQDVLHQDIRKLHWNRIPILRYPSITMQQNVRHQDICTLQCNRIPKIRICVYYNTTGCPISRELYITMHQDAPNPDIRILQSNKMSHKITVYYNATGCPTSRYPYITAGCPTSRYPYITKQQDAPHLDIRILQYNRMPHI